MNEHEHEHPTPAPGADDGIARINALCDRILERLARLEQEGIDHDDH